MSVLERLAVGLVVIVACAVPFMIVVTICSVLYRLTTWVLG